MMRFYLIVVLCLVLAVTAALAGTPGSGVALRSGTLVPDLHAAGEASKSTRWIVRFQNPTGWFQKGRLEVAGARIETPLPGQAFLVTVPAGEGPVLASLPGVDWAAPYEPRAKIAPEIAAVSESSSDDIIVLLHLFRDADPQLVAAELASLGLQVEGAGSGSRFDRIVLRMTSNQVSEYRDVLSEREDVFWISRRHRRTLANDTSIWVGQSGLYAGQTTPVFDQGIYGEGQIAAVLDTGLDADMCYFRDRTLGLPPTNDGAGTTVDLNQRKVIAVDFLWNAEDPLDPTDWDTQGHGTHVAGTLAGDNLSNPIDHDSGDGMAPAAKLVIQDAGYQADSCGDLPGIGCPVTDLIPVFQQAYDQGARTHSNSWNDNESASVQNNYTDASEDVDEFMWNHPDFLIVFACGNHALGGTGTMGSPSTAKNTLTTGGTYKGENAEYLSDISAWGPTDDGRIKPDVVFPGASIQSAGNDGDVTTENCLTQGMTGTSMTAPGVSGMSLLVREYFEKGFYPTGAAVPADAFSAGSALVKAMIINSAVSITGDAEGNPITIPGDEQGWGRVLLDNVLHFAGETRTLYVDEDTSGFTGPGDPPVLYQLEVTDTSEPLKITLVWNDYPSTPAASVHLVNDLDLRVFGASGSFHGNFFVFGHSVDHGVPDRLNNVEQVLVEAPVPGMYTIEVSPHAVPSGPQPYALVVSGAGLNVTAGPHPGYVSHAVDDSGPNGNGDGVLDPGETAVVSVTLENIGDSAATSVIGQLHTEFPDLLKVYDGTAGYPDMPVGGQGSSQSPHYEVVLQPETACGQVVLATLSVTGDGFQARTGFTVDVGVREKDFPSPDTPISIPRKTPAEVNSYINVPDSFEIKEVDVTLNIDHDDISMLEVILYPPGGVTPIYLHNNSGPGVSGIHTTYDELTEPDGPGSLESFVGLDAQGSWRLKVVHGDPGGGSGTLENWTLHLKSDTPFGCNPVSCGEPVPPEVGETLMLDPSGVNDVLLAWTAVGGASDYNVWRSENPQFTLETHLAATGGANSYADAGARDLPGAHFYLVRSVNSCRWESP